MSESESWDSDSTIVCKTFPCPFMVSALYHTGNSQIRLVDLIHSFIQQMLSETIAVTQQSPAHLGLTQEVERRHHHKHVTGCIVTASAAETWLDSHGMCLRGFSRCMKWDPQ